MFLRYTIFATILVAIKSLDTSIYRTCEQVPFCAFLQNLEPDPSLKLNAGAVTFSDNSFSMILYHEGIEDILLTISGLEEDIIRVSMEEVNSTRYHVDYALAQEPKLTTCTPVETQEIIVLNCGLNTVVVNRTSLIYVQVFRDSELVLVLNGEGGVTLGNEGDYQAFSFDAFFPGAQKAYGLPEHADSLSLSTTGENLYRIYALDAPGFILDSPMALYGAVPLLYAHSPESTTGLFLLNAAEQWVNLTRQDGGFRAYFMVDRGAFDVFVLLGPTPADVSRQYTNLTGVLPIPPLWSLGYHQCRYSYLNQEDVKDVVANFDNNNFPLDVIWGDVYTQDGHRYFTWDPETFGDPIEMLNNISSTNRKFVTVVDPHFKVDEDYFVYAEGVAKDYFVKNENGSVYVGDTWPGDAAYLDFLNPDAVEYYKSLFAYDVFPSTPTLAGYWNDMNEPSVFDDDNEWTFPRKNIMYGGVLNREIHSTYGFLHTRATYEALLQRDNSTKRPFILSRSFFAGSQRNGIAVWNGDTFATFDYLAITIPMCLSISLAGVPFCGGDVGGFFDDPSEELLVRWYQLGAWLPFFRAHASVETARREPYLFDNVTQSLIRTAIEGRYAHLPVWYSLFYEHSTRGLPVMRPLFFQYPQEEEVYDIQDQFMVGADILVCPIVRSNVAVTRVYLPGGFTELWYELYENLLYRGGVYNNVSATLYHIPVFYRGGSVIPRKDTPRPNTVAMTNDSYTVYVFLNSDQEAFGEIYVDDFDGFGYKQGEFLHLGIRYANGTVTTEHLAGNYSESQFSVDSYLVYRPPNSTRSGNEPSKVEPMVFRKTAQGEELRNFKYDLTKKNVINLF